MTSDRCYIFNTILMAIFLSITGIFGITQKHFPDLGGDVLIVFLYALAVHIAIIILGLLMFGKMSLDDMGADDNKGGNEEK
jgi:hypothetical protein